MDTDLLLVVGLILLGLALPPIVGALSEGRAPKAASIMVFAGGSLVVLALNNHTYTLDEVPEAFMRVVARFLR